MRRRTDKSLVKIYKDLMISKRELSDLRQSISKTLYGLKQPFSKNPASIQPKRKMCLKCKAFHDLAAAHQCKSESHKCNYCAQYFPTIDSLERHKKQVHHFCKVCNEIYQESPAVHEAQMCGQKRLDCQRCGAKVKRKDLDEHISKCCFHFCQKCKKSIYFRAYCYHIGKCSQNTGKRIKQESDKSDMIRTRKNLQGSDAQRNRYLPCSIIK